MRQPALASFTATTGTSSIPTNACTVSSERTLRSVAASASSRGTSSAATMAVSCSLPALPPSRRTGLFGGELFVSFVRRLLRRNGDLLRRDLAGDDGHVDLLRIALAGHEDRRAGLERAAEHEVGERILDHALDRAAQRPGAHGGVVTLLDEELLGLVRQ